VFATAYPDLPQFIDQPTQLGVIQRNPYGRNEYLVTPEIGSFTPCSNPLLQFEWAACPQAGLFVSSGASLWMPRHYASVADSPWVTEIDQGRVKLETFEDYYYSTQLKFFGGGRNFMSIDADDGIVDGRASGGISIGLNYGMTSLNFEADAFGHYPTRAGFAVIDVRAEDQQAMIAAYSGDGTLLAAYGTSTLDFRWSVGVDNVRLTDKDQFIGFESDQGIRYIEMFLIRGIDHVQWMYPVPEPTFLVPMAGLFWLRRKRSERTKRLE
jgi:hypothetical protein